MHVASITRGWGRLLLNESGVTSERGIDDTCTPLRCGSVIPFFFFFFFFFFLMQHLYKYHFISYYTSLFFPRSLFSHPFAFAYLLINLVYCIAILGSRRCLRTDSFLFIF